MPAAGRGPGQPTGIPALGAPVVGVVISKHVTKKLCGVSGGESGTEGRAGRREVFHRGVSGRSGCPGSEGVGGSGTDHPCGGGMEASSGVGQRKTWGSKRTAPCCPRLRASSVGNSCDKRAPSWAEMAKPCTPASRDQSLDRGPPCKGMTLGRTAVQPRWPLEGWATEGVCPPH